MALLDYDGKPLSLMEPGLHPEVEDLLQELPSAVHKVLRIFLLSQHLQTIRDLSALHADDLTEAFKATPPDFTLGHRAAVRRLCAAARERFETTSVASACVTAHQQFGEYHDSAPQTPRMSRIDGWSKVTRAQQGESKALRSPRSQSNINGYTRAVVRSPRNASSSRTGCVSGRDGLQSEASRSSTLCSQGGSFGRAGSNGGNSGRETLWTRMYDKADGSPGPSHRAASQFSARPASPRAVMGTAPRPADLWASTLGVRSP
uniref:Uncharacterized protein n=1 Tax=Alexandrium andersonii TaxID=327968 RepID=A0A7S2CIN1_9DINO|mmetsp:Transcript_39454/g.89711  ORF Transcript_39454/g.89711 Transcript_39454/m.89711 type:complete len:261 (+) Transcript_39454:66-848(+)